MAQEKDPRVTKAFIAMKNIGIAAQTVKPVLKRLLKLYNRNWEFIEEDNYRTLADAIFEYENDKMIEGNGIMVNDGQEPPFKKPNLALREDQTSSRKDSGSRRLDLEEGEIPTDPSRQELIESSQSFSRNPRGEPNSLIHQASIRDRQNDHISTGPAPTGENSVTQRLPDEFYAGQAFDEHSFLQKKREKIQEYHEDGNVTKPTRKQPLNCSQHVTLPLLAC
ncbi:hypothetical protein ACH5RR_016211 [Cinchona calisaya]|uniref:WIYLD domain-containing protein n=1 Tax=Cinchona calisaya TaxID=153742 RepID=A0ABD2ZVC1_9GENT